MYLDAFLYDYKFRDGTGMDVSDITDEQKLVLAQNLYPNELAKIDSKNMRRVEQLLTRGPSKTDDRKAIKIPCKIIGLELDKPTLKQNIQKRTKAMLNNGFVQEVEKLRIKYGKDCPTLLTTGYKEVGEYLDGKIEKSELEAQIVASTLRLAKKQATWFRRNESIDWCNSTQKAIASIEQYLAEV